MKGTVFERKFSNTSCKEWYTLFKRKKKWCNFCEHNNFIYTYSMKLSKGHFVYKVGESSKLTFKYLLSFWWIDICSKVRLHTDWNRYLIWFLTRSSKLIIKKWYICFLPLGAHGLVLYDAWWHIPPLSTPLQMNIISDSVM